MNDYFIRRYAYLCSLLFKRNMLHDNIQVKYFENALVKYFHLLYFEENDSVYEMVEKQLKMTSMIKYIVKKKHLFYLDKRILDMYQTKIENMFFTNFQYSIPAMMIQAVWRGYRSRKFLFS